MRIGIAISAGRIAATATRRRRVIWSAESSYSGTEDLVEALASLAAERPSGSMLATVALDSSVACLKTVHGLPVMRRSDLRAHVQFNSRRYFLQNGVPLVTDARHIGKRGAAPVQMASAHVPFVEAIAAGLTAASIRLTAITHAQLLCESAEGLQLSDFSQLAARSRQPPLELMPLSVQARLRARSARTLKKWALLFPLSVVAMAASLVESPRISARLYRAEIMDSRARAEDALRLQADVDDADAALRAYSAFDGAGPGMTPVLGRITRALPDSTFLVSLRVDVNQTGFLAGYSPHAAAVLARLEQSAGLVGLSFDGPVTREVVAGRELERFAMRFRLTRDNATQ